MNPSFDAIATRDCVGLLRALAFGGATIGRVQEILSGPLEGVDFQALAWDVSTQSIDGVRARRVFEVLRDHQAEMSKQVQRSVPLTVAALDLAETVGTTFEVEGDEATLSYRELVNLTFRDPLTQLYNFRFFEKRFKEEIQRAQRYRRSVSLVMLDIDHFKNFNDTHGHPNGNRALIQLAQILVSESRETDMVVRYGGEEFAFILPETTKRMAHELAERVRRKVESTQIVLEDGERHRVSISVGIGTFPRDSSSPEKLITAADTALYAAKSQGRNRVVAFAPDTRADFALHLALYLGKQVDRVAVVGDFNDWDKLADHMVLNEDKTWRAQVPVAPGTYEYKFVVNGEQWIKDPACSETVSDGYWGENSIIRVTRKPRT